MSSGVDNFSGASDESDEDNNSGIELVIIYAAWIRTQWGLRMVKIFGKYGGFNWDHLKTGQIAAILSKIGQKSLGFQWSRFELVRAKAIATPSEIQTMEIRSSLSPF